MDKERLKALKRLLPTLSEEEAKVVIDAFNKGEMTGYATVDRPWENFYLDFEKTDRFLNTTPYQGLVQENSNFLSDPAIEYFGAHISYGEMLKNIEIVAKSFEEYGIKKGDFVTICSTTTSEVIYAFYALSKIGAVANVISPFYEPEELMARVDECQSNVIIMVDKFLPKFKDALNRDKRKNVIVLPLMNSSLLRFLTKGYRVDGKTNETGWKTFIADGRKRAEAAMDPYYEGKPQAMVYSSGTTGASKGILLSVDSFQKLINAYGSSGFDTSRGQSVYQNIPPWHSTGLSLGINFPLSYGVKVCTDPRFEHDVFAKNIVKFNPEYILTNTSMYQGLTSDANERRLARQKNSHLKYPVEGGEPLTDEDYENIESVIKKPLLNGYGECECGATVTTDITSHRFAPGASGIPLRDITTVGIFDDDFKELKYGERGNILVKTEIGMIEYYKNEQATKDFFKIDSNGDKWSQTGDIGYLNEDGSLVVLGRKIDFSVIDGEKMYNFDIERAILASKVVKLCEVQTHPEDDNKLVAHIVWRNDVADILKKNPERINEYFDLIQETVLKVMNKPEAVPYNFCIRESFPSAHSGKRDIKFIKQDIEGLIEIEKPQLKK